MNSVHQLKITLEHVKPVVWREVLVPSDLRLDRLHQVIQIVMGWQDCHLHQFSNGVRGMGEMIFGPMQDAFDDGIGPPLRSETQATLLELAPAKGDKFRYWYDFGDDWLHRVVVTAVGAPESLPIPRCIKAAGACPPDDCGGPPGYERLLSVLADPAHEEHADMREWIGGDWNAEYYDIAAINQDLTALATRWRRPARKTKSKAKAKERRS